MSCERVDRDYRIGLRVGALFTILGTSSIGVFGPLLIRKVAKLSLDGLIFTMIKQFGTGVLIATSFVHVRLQSERGISSGPRDDEPWLTDRTAADACRTHVQA